MDHQDQVDRAALLERRNRLAREYGEWRDTLPLGSGLYTLPQRSPDAELRVAAILQACADALGRPLSEARVLDLGAAEGLFAVEFASHGAQVVALEAREGNVEKMRFVADALGLANLDVVRDDVRNLSAASHGEFDLVLCLGLLYHLDAEAADRAARGVAEVCRRVAVFDTHVSFKGRTSAQVGGRTYHGTRQREFDPDTDEREQERLARSSVGNPESFWPTLPSLGNMLADAGFSSMSEVVWPRHDKTSDRMTLLAFRGESVRPVSIPGYEPPPWPEDERRRPHHNQGIAARIKLLVGPRVPAAAKELVRRRRERRRPHVNR